MEKAIFESRRKKLIKAMKLDQTAIIFAASRSSYPRYFLQDKNFYYLTGLEIPDAILTICKRKKKTVITLFIERNIPERIVWEGKKIEPEKAKKLTGIDTVKYLDEFDFNINNFLFSINTLYVNKAITPFSSLINRSQEFIQKAIRSMPSLQIKDLNNIISLPRSIKDEYEISQLQRAIDVTGKGIIEIYKNAKSGMNEYELEAILYKEIIGSGLRHVGFKSIIASEVNATTLHYEENNSKIQENSLVLLDVGAACNNYSADISRTFPVNGKFTARQKEVYEQVLSIQKNIIEMIKPGISFEELNKKTNELITKALFELGLIKDKKERTKYYMHGFGHFLGLDTHDVGDRNITLKPGNVITVEPGIYIPEEKIGVRIEDDILVTKTGFKILSENIPKEIEELEKLCAK
ncbi:MAG: aminopeptidase P family protein [Candidatus Cloacimonetes bacterium]|nr:aminopeptidase P family protein [Candidatus Cloacimonadota bacterium]